ncbi:Smr/MutS family protein [bacterium]|nr:Smr/MutS family protein [bacterium]
MDFLLQKDINPLEHALKVLEFPKILEHIASKCLSDVAKKFVIGLRPSTDEESIGIRGELIEEIRQLLAISGQPELTGLSDPEPFVDKASKEGVLAENELWEIAQTSIIVHRLRKIANDSEKYPRLRSLLDGLEDTVSVHSNIIKFIEPPGIFKENASERLTQLRIAKKQIHDKLQDKLQNMLEDDKYKDYWQEPLITLRNERFVIPLKAEHKQHIPSVIHDRSATGATLFVEPIEMIPLNNQLRELELEEKAEKQRILRNLSGIVSAYAEQFLFNLQILHQLDFLVAVAHFADGIGANSPSVSRDNPLVIVGARHPILILEQGRENVIPLDIELNLQIKGIIITGPNMGGKTVALKTIGLICAMSACGIPVPADSRTQIPLFSKFFADIGDEQSVEASISSFASHIFHYKLAAENADEHSLVLFDELGSATDPQEGTPISWALVEHLLDRNATIIANTHLGGLLGLATTRGDIENSAMEFNQNRMEPTYRLLVGVPGRSWALEIAKMLGFPDRILNRAGELYEGGNALDEIISQLQRKLADVEDNRERIIEERTDLANKRELLEALISSNQIKEKELLRLRKSYEEQRDTRIFAALERKLGKIQDEWNSIILEKSPEPKKRRQGDEFISRLKKQIKESERKFARNRGKSKELHSGDRIFVYRLHKWGDVLDPTDESGYVRVLIGNLPMRIHSSGVDTETEYERKKRNKNKNRKSGSVHYEPRKSPPNIDVRGLSADDAWDKIDHILDDAFSSNEKKIFIIHGKGKGTLRRIIRDKLHSDKRISQLMLPDERDGGDGATIAVIKSE